MSIIFVALLLTLAKYSAGQSVNFTDCGTGNVKDVRIIPCSGNPCVLKLGTNVTVEADFVSPLNTNKLSEVIKGVIRGRELPFPEQRADPCSSGNIIPDCPLKKGNSYQFKAAFEVKPFYPPISIKVKYSLTDPTGQSVVCVQVSAKIVDPDGPKTTNQRPRSSRPKSRSNKPKNNN
ncbi:unnamed protein product [Oppiella nova]|uniref:MD-2-related lipid-recognition domain-containing protein n=1 Tax=Oppiella nova TaxID=334625 RepID=A0A7R9QEL7_9ACAR|nr:unnamed protein product [Oppiella nova]CAG2163487.1 unnamed protein product [Oppiella nova]